MIGTVLLFKKRLIYNLLEMRPKPYMIKHFTTLLFFFIGFTTLLAQQDQQYTQFMFYKLGYNPAYAGSNESACITALHRSQWLGLEGAPETQVLTFNMPLLYNRIGIGMNLTRNVIGITERYTLDGAYSYRIPMGRGRLGIGLQASIRHLSVDYSDERLTATQGVSADGAIPAGRQTRYVPNFGFGIYYNSPSFFLGVSLPRLLENSIDFNETGEVFSEEVRHFYLMGGVLIPLGEIVALQPQVLLKYAMNTPFDAEGNLSLIFLEKYAVGVTYRVGGSSEIGAGASADLMLSAHITKQIMVGAAYDVVLSELRDYNSGSIEAILRFCFNQPEGKEIVNPRFF